MSVRVMSAVWHDAKEYREGPLLVLLALADWANDDGWCWPAVPAIAEKSRLTERQVYSILAGLESDGVIVRQSGGGRGKSTRYRVIVAALGRVPGNPANPEAASGFTAAEKPAGAVVEKAVNGEAQFRVSCELNPEAGDTKTLKPDASQYRRTVIEPSENHQPTPTPPTDAGGVQNRNFLHAVRDAWTGVVDGVRRHLLSDRPERDHLASGAEEWRRWSFDSLAVADADRKRNGRLWLTLHARDPDAARRGLEKYRRTWEAQLRRWYGEVAVLQVAEFQEAGGMAS